MSVNKVILVGNAGRDPEVRYFDNNRSVANFTLATSERGYTTQSGINVPERTEWHRIVVYGSLAKVVENYVRKGTQVYIEGKIQSRTWTDKEGRTRDTVEIIADNLQLLGRRPENAAQQQSAPAAQAAAAAPSFNDAPISEPAESESLADDLPF